MSSDTFINLNRQFSELKSYDVINQLSSSEDKSNDYSFENVTNWGRLEKRYRTILLAEGGAGKTREMKERCCGLQSSGEFAYFIPLEALGNDTVEALLSLEEQIDSFKRWKNKTADPAWFYLDAVDELKLREGSFSTSLKTLKLALQGAESRARIIISCRPSDWDKIDIDEFEKILPAQNIFEDELDVSSQGYKRLKENPTPEDYFLSPLLGEDGITIEPEGDRDFHTKKSEKEALVIYRLCDLDTEQIRSFVQEYRPEESESLLAEIELKDRWDFGRRPQDLIEMIAHWSRYKTLGSYTEHQESFLLSSLRDREDRPAAKHQLPPKKAQAISARLAFALAVSKERNIQNPNSKEIGTSGLVAKALLTDLNSADIKALLRLRLFDPPSYDRIRFHRRDTEEYLAAWHLQKLNGIGMGSKQNLRETLFTQTASGVESIIPSMKNIAVWLAQWNEDVKEKFIQIDPVLLISEADSEQFSIDEKCRILRSIINFSDDSRLSSLPYHAATLRRFSSQELAATIKELWKDAKQNKEQHDFIISLIDEGKIKGCGIILSEVINSSTSNKTNKIIAFRALLNFGNKELVEPVVSSIMTTPKDWNGKMIRASVSYMYPKYLSTKQLFQLIYMLGEATGDHGMNFTHSLHEIIRNLEPSSPKLLEIRNEIYNLILSNQTEDSAYYYAQSIFSWLSPRLAQICNEQLMLAMSSEDKNLLNCCITVNHFNESAQDSYVTAENINLDIISKNYSKEEVFLAEYDFVKSNFSEKNGSIRVKSQYSLTANFDKDDIEWLKRVTVETEDANLSVISYREILIIWSRDGSPENEKPMLYETAKGKVHLEELLDNWLNPYEPDRDNEQYKKKREAEEKKRIDDWKEWRKSLMNEPDIQFDEENIGRNRHYLFKWLENACKSNGSYQVWNSDFLLNAFNEDIHDRVLNEFKNYWRTVEIIPRSQRSENKGTRYSWLYALNGVIIESETLGWANNLTKKEIVLATHLAQVEINGLATYLNELAEVHPQQVSDTLSNELKEQLLHAENQKYVPLLQDISNSSLQIKQLVAPSLLDFISSWKTLVQSNNDDPEIGQYNLSQAIDILHEVSNKIDVTRFTNIVYTHFKSSPSVFTAVTWLRSLFKLDIDKASTAVEQVLAKMKLDARKPLVIRWFASLFDPFRGIRLTTQNPDDYPYVLSRLARLAHTYISHSEDEIRETGVVYSSNSRDKAQRARSVILNELISLQHPKVPEILKRMAEEPVFESVKQYLKERIHIITLNNLEPKPWTIDEIQSYQLVFEQMPTDRESLARLIKNRMLDLQHDIFHKDFFPRRTIREITKEEEMQRFLALILDNKSRGLYGILREDEAADGKKTDIRIIAANHRQKAVIEIKLADKRWTVKQLEKAIEDQLKQQYLRHEDCRTGFFLITNHSGHENRFNENSKRNLSRRHWLHPQTKKRMSWEELICHLQSIVEKILVNNKEIRIIVFGLDLRDPVLRSAQ